ncbi:hypothetical protein [Kribbella sp. VKM Ac-2568]|nr:hypothetical protein [Kribbella sp. VKM Ac-2568]
MSVSRPGTPLRRLASARAAFERTVLGEQPSTAAISASGRSS